MLWSAVMVASKMETATCVFPVHCLKTASQYFYANMWHTPALAVGVL